MYYYLLSILFIFLLFTGCKKQVSESTISGTYKLDTVKELKLLQNETIQNDFVGAQFIFNNQGTVQCILPNDTLFGSFQLNTKNDHFFDQDGNTQTKKEKGLSLYMVNRNNSKFINWQLWNIRFKNNRTALIGEQERIKNNYLFEFVQQ